MREKISHKEVKDNLINIVAKHVIPKVHETDYGCVYDYNHFRNILNEEEKKMLQRIMDYITQYEKYEAGLREVIDNIYENNFSKFMIAKAIEEAMGEKDEYAYSYVDFPEASEMFTNLNYYREETKDYIIYSTLDREEHTTHQNNIKFDKVNKSYVAWREPIGWLHTPDREEYYLEIKGELYEAVKQQMREL